MLYALTSQRSCVRPGSRTVKGALHWLHLLALAFVLLFTNGFEASKHDLEELYHLALPYMGKPAKQQTQAATSSTSSSKDGGTGFVDLRDSYVPVFTGQPSNYKEWRQRIHLYHRKMTISKRSNESVLNIVGSFTGVTWRLFQDWSIEELEKDGAFERLIKTLDDNFAYDSRVQLPADFEQYTSTSSIDHQVRPSFCTWLTMRRRTGSCNSTRWTCPLQCKDGIFSVGHP